MNTFFAFAQDEDGAVTVDWIVLTAAVVGLGAAVLGSVQTGVLSLAGKTETALTNVTVPTITIGGSDGT